MTENHLFNGFKNMMSNRNKSHKKIKKIAFFSIFCTQELNFICLNKLLIHIFESA